MGELIGDLYWRTPSGVMLKLNRVSPKDFAECGPLMLQGIPVVYSVWPNPVEEKSDADPQV